MSDDKTSREDIAATLADTLVEQGLTPEQTAALVGALGKFKTKPTQDDWTRAARLFRVQKGLPTGETAGKAKWDAPYKISAAEARLELATSLEAASLLYDRLWQETLTEIVRKAPDDHTTCEIVLSALAEIVDMPAPSDEAFHLLGAILHAMASMGHRRAMWSLAYHLRAFAAHPDTTQDCAETYIKTATMWETIGSWTRQQSPSWSSPDGLLPASDRWLAPETWVKNISAPLSMLVTNSRFTATITPVAFAVAPEKKTDDKPEEPVPVSEDEETKKFRLLDHIGGIADKDDDTTAWAKTKPWRVLLEPLPLVGAFDPDAAYAALRREFPWMDTANRAIGEMIAGLAAGRKRLSPLLIVGEPGIGKTAWALRVAALCKLPTTMISLSTTASSMLISGDEREWSSSAPCIAAKSARDLNVANPMIILDELEKASTIGGANSAHQALLPLLDCDDTRLYFDLFLQGNLNLAHFSWLFLANSLTGISAPLLDRLTVIQTRRPTMDEIGRSLDDMIAAWLPGQTVEDAVKAQALAKFEQTRSLRDMRAVVERASLQSLWQPPGPRLV